MAEQDFDSFLAMCGPYGVLPGGGGRRDSDIFVPLEQDKSWVSSHDSFICLIN